MLPFLSLILFEEEGGGTRRKEEEGGERKRRTQRDVESSRVREFEREQRKHEAKRRPRNSTESQSTTFKNLNQRFNARQSTSVRRHSPVVSCTWKGFVEPCGIHFEEHHSFSLVQLSKDALRCKNTNNSTKQKHGWRDGEVSVVH
jgi:hypothetical protein